MLDSSTSSSKKSTLLCSVPSTPTSSIVAPVACTFNKQQTSAFLNKKQNSAATTSSIASSIQDSLNQLSLSTTSSQTNVINMTNLMPETIGLPAEPIKMMNLQSTSKQTSDYNSDTSSGSLFG